jgi:broad specificity phosphatase PhoE
MTNGGVDDLASGGVASSMLVLWARHGQNHANLTGQFSHRRLDLDLTARGREQAEGLAAAFAARLSEAHELPVLFSSPLRRALQTAEIVATRLGVAVEVLDGLREVNVGDLDGRADAEAWRIYDSVLADWRLGHYERSFPGGEDWHQLCTRLHSALCRIAAAGAGDTAVVIAHGANLRAALPGLAHVADPGSDLDTGQFADLLVTATATAVRVQLLAWRPNAT